MPVLPEVLKQHRYFQQVMKLCKREHINGKKKYTGNALHGLKIQNSFLFGVTKITRTSDIVILNKVTALPKKQQPYLGSKEANDQTQRNRQKG